MYLKHLVLFPERQIVSVICFSLKIMPGLAEVCLRAANLCAMSWSSVGNCSGTKHVAAQESESRAGWCWLVDVPEQRSVHQRRWEGESWESSSCKQLTAACSSCRLTRYAQIVVSQLALSAQRLFASPPSPGSEQCL